MPRRDDLETICILGSGPIVIGQACEFDYSGTQAARALRREGYRVILINSNPATIMTDPEVADATYIEPLTPAVVASILERERPEAVLPTMGGQTALNLAMDLHAAGTLERLGVELLGTKPEVIERAEDRQRFRALIEGLGMRQADSGIATTMAEAEAIAERVGFPAILRPSFTLGGGGGSIAYDAQSYRDLVERALAASPTSQVQIDRSLLGWKEYELELMRDKMDNVVVICGIENFDPMGVHTGDSITVAPIQTLSDREYQAMRDDAIAIIRAVGVESGGCNIQFAVDPASGERVVIEMNPRVSRSSALASKATGYPIAKVSALLSVGYTLDEITNDITATTSAAFEPVLDYVVTKIPRFAFDKFPDASDTLTTQMKSVGEVMAIGASFPESLLKAVRSLEDGSIGVAPIAPEGATDDDFDRALERPSPDRLRWMMDAVRRARPVDAIAHVSGVDPWFIDQLAEIARAEAAFREAATGGLASIAPEAWRAAKQYGLGDEQIAVWLDSDPDAVRAAREAAGVLPVFKQVDTCAAEFEAVTSYFYSTFDGVEDEAEPSARETVVILGSGPNRIGQGVEFDYCAVHAAQALRDKGLRTVMINCNPETVSTDYDVSDRLYFEPLTLETVLAVLAVECPVGVILQFGGQTPLKLADALGRAGVPLMGTGAGAIDRTEDRHEFGAIVDKLGLKQPRARTTIDEAEARRIASELGYPVLVRPSYVLGGQGMFIANDEAELDAAFRPAREAGRAGAPVLIDEFLRDAIEVDVDVVSDGERAVIAGLMEHIEEAGVHSGDSACVTPPFHLAESVTRQIRAQSLALARELQIVGLMNVQFAVRDYQVYVLEVNPRASRTVPFISKAIGRPIAGIAARAMAGDSLSSLGFTNERFPRYYSVKQSVYPFNKFRGVDTILGPQMVSTGEVMGIDDRFALAYAKAQFAASNPLPTPPGTVFVSVRDADKWTLIPTARRIAELGFSLIATSGTAALLSAHGIEARLVHKVKEGSPHIVDAILEGQVCMVLNTTTGARAIEDSRSIRRAAVDRRVPYFTTIEGARAAASALAAMSGGEKFDVVPLQERFESVDG